MHWTLTYNFAEAGHPPVVDVNGHPGTELLILKVNPGERHILDASGTHYADHASADDNLEYTWMLYNDVNGFHFFGMGPEVNLEALEGVPSDTRVIDTAVFAKFTRARKIAVTVPQIENHRQTGLVTPYLHILLQVTNRTGPCPIRRYKQVIFSFIHGGPSESLQKIPQSAAKAYRMHGNIDAGKPRVDYSQPPNYTPCKRWGVK